MGKRTVDCVRLLADETDIEIGIERRLNSNWKFYRTIIFTFVVAMRQNLDILIFLADRVKRRSSKGQIQRSFLSKKSSADKFDKIKCSNEVGSTFKSLKTAILSISSTCSAVQYRLQSIFC